MSYLNDSLNLENSHVIERIDFLFVFYFKIIFFFFPNTLHTHIHYLWYKMIPSICCFLLEKKNKKKFLGTIKYIIENSKDYKLLTTIINLDAKRTLQINKRTRSIYRRGT